MLWVLIRIASAILMSTHNIGFYEDLTKIIFELSSNIIKYAPYFFCSHNCVWISVLQYVRRQIEELVRRNKNDTVKFLNRLWGWECCNHYNFKLICLTVENSGHENFPVTNLSCGASGLKCLLVIDPVSRDLNFVL